MKEKKCSVCGKDAIAMCPACGAYVHHSYGQQAAACSSVHEQACKGAKELRDGKVIK